MPVHLQREIEKLKKEILGLGTMVEESVQKSVRSFDDMEPNAATKVIDSDIEIDEKEVEIEEICLKILALHQPVAIDLRFIVSALKINNDLERIGDLAVNIAERTIYLAGRGHAEINVDFRKMGRLVRNMLKKSLDSLVNMDPTLAREVCAADDEVDIMNRRMFKSVVKVIPEQPDEVDGLLQYMLVARHLERIADHATNIAEDVIYMVEGNIVRHKLKEEEESGEGK